jgi:hypothetical protein
MSTIGIDKKMNPGDIFEWMPLPLPTRWIRDTKSFRPAVP